MKFLIGLIQNVRITAPTRTCRSIVIRAAHWTGMMPRWRVDLIRKALATLGTVEARDEKSAIEGRPDFKFENHFQHVSGIC